MSNKNEEKKGFGPALAALILAIVGFAITGMVALVFSGMQDMIKEVLQEALDEEFGVAISTGALTPAQLDAFKMGLKIAFGAIYFSGGLFLFIALICDIVSICKYYGNKTETKAKSTIVLAYIALAFLVTSVAIAVFGVMDFAKVVDVVMAPYYK